MGQCLNQQFSSVPNFSVNSPAERFNVPIKRLQQSASMSQTTESSRERGGGGQTGATEKEKTNQQKALPIPPTPPLPRTNGTDLVDAPA